jgi:ketosteroid isomerase-like protein
MPMTEGESAELEQQVEIVRRAVEAFGDAISDRKAEGFLGMLDADVDLELPSALRQDVIRLHGVEEVRGYLEETADAYVELRVEPREFRPLDRGRLLVIGRWQGRASGGTTAFGTPVALIVELRGEKVSRLHAFMDEQQALEAAGGA